MTRVSQLLGFIGFAALLGGCPIYIGDTHGHDSCVGSDCPRECPDGTVLNDDGDCVAEGCHRNSDCDTDEMCNLSTNECEPAAMSCTVDGDCDLDERCEANVCVPSDSCDADNDCSGGQVCDFRGVCVDPSGCRTNADCSGGALCLSGVCTQPGNTCQFNYECGAGRACVNNACVNVCDDNSDCPSGQSCDSGLCVDTRECDETSDCDSGERCVNGQCFKDCRTGGEAACGSGEMCSADGFCRPDVRPRPFCTNDNQCAADHVCRDGVCRTPCPTMQNTECQSFDVQLPHCAMASGSSEYLCYAANERNPECAVQTDCNENQSCIDAVCRNN